MKIQESKKYIGIDLGDKTHEICLLDSKGDVLARRKIANHREALANLAKDYPLATCIMECGSHSPWISRYLESLGMNVLVANPRKLRAIYQSERKSDVRDAEMLARIGRLDPKLLHPIKHGSEESQHDLLVIKMRDMIVRSRVGIVNAIRFTLKSMGYRVKNSDTRRFHKTVLEQIPTSCHVVIEPLLEVLAGMTEKIKQLDKQIKQLTENKYPEAMRLQAITGVGPVTSLYYVLKIEDPNRFSRVRDVGSYLGLVPRRDQSGATDKQLRISKAGDSYLRRLLVSAAQYILGPFGKDSELRTYGLRLSERGGSRARKQAVVAVARKLAVLMASLWKSGNEYQPQGVGCH